MFEKQAKNVILAIGSNLGNKQHNIEKAKYFLNSDEKIKIMSSSAFYRSESWPNKKDPYFLNIVLKCITTFNPVELFTFIKKIEKSLGRSKSYKNAPRTCDIDIIDFNQNVKKIVVNGLNVTVPHPRMNSRNFVLIPFYEINGCWKHPKNHKKIVNLISNLSINQIRGIKIL